MPGRSFSLLTAGDFLRSGATDGLSAGEGETDPGWAAVGLASCDRTTGAVIRMMRKMAAKESECICQSLTIRLFNYSKTTAAVPWAKALSPE